MNEKSQENAVVLENASKKFRIYKDRPMTLKDRAISAVKSGYSEFYALDNVSLTIKKGEAVGLIGANGSGKSTVLKLISGILTPDGGIIDVNGKISALIELGAGFHPDFSGRENIYTNAAIFGLSRARTDAIIDDIIDFSGISDFIDAPVRTYSSGMYMRLAFSVAIHVSPEILLIDEILAVGDGDFQKKCFDKIMEFKNNNVTIILVTHDLESVKKLCDKAYLLENGKIAACGTPTEVISRYTDGETEDSLNILINSDEIDIKQIMAEIYKRLEQRGYTEEDYKSPQMPVPGASEGYDSERLNNLIGAAQAYATVQYWWRMPGGAKTAIRKAVRKTVFFMFRHTFTQQNMFNSAACAALHTMKLANDNLERRIFALENRLSDDKTEEDD